MSESRFNYRPGDRVVVEGRVVAVEDGRPYGAVTVRFDEATDPSFLLDGVDVVVPQILVTPLPGVDVPSDYVAREGFYPEENE